MERIPKFIRRMADRAQRDYEAERQRKLSMYECSDAELDRREALALLALLELALEEE